ncbi:VanW family protein [Lentibacillus sediminis]|uniref:VanW family protein n=1 Tax=Lentibacillus sediminis TaxID=1940529 RepID=UPI000C1C605F|nr:VanW family protein [Lentibacillus sediminis]
MKTARFAAILFIVFSIGELSAEAASADEPVITLEKVEIDQYELPYLDKAFIDEVRLDFLMKTLEEKMYQAPENAAFDEHGKLMEEKPGYTLDKQQFEKVFREAFYSSENEGVTVPGMAIHPRVDEALLMEISEKEIGSYATNFRESNKERSHNIQLATEAIDNHVVFPGKRFSFNEVVGERTAERGYKQAPVIVKGELSEDIGGGICQVSSTLFNAVDLKGIQIVERYAHSRSVPYVPPGRDATVSWWGPDFVFKNEYNQPVLIRANSTNGRMAVRLFTSESAEYFRGE